MPTNVSGLWSTGPGLFLGMKDVLLVTITRGSNRVASFSGANRVTMLH
jgi:hypothetical protein